MSEEDKAQIPIQEEKLQADKKQQEDQPIENEKKEVEEMMEKREEKVDLDQIKSEQQKAEEKQQKKEKESQAIKQKKKIEEVQKKIDEIKIQQMIDVEESPQKSEQKKSQNSSANKDSRPLTIKLGKEYIATENKQSLKLTKMEIDIKVIKSEEIGFALGKHSLHHIVGSDKHGPVDIKRKTSEFEGLRKILLERWPGCFIPLISDKTDTKTEELRKIHKRKNLQNFIMKIARSQFIYYKEEVQLFLRSEGIDVEEMFAQMPILKVGDVIDRLRYSFCEDELQSSPEWASRTSKFSTSLKKISNNLGSIAKKILKLAEYYEIYSRLLINTAQVLKGYQQNCLLEYVDKNPEQCIVLRNGEESLKNLSAMNQAHNIFYDIYFFLQNEARDADSLLEIINAMEMFRLKKEELQRKSRETRQEIDQLCLGHKNMKLMTGKKTKEELQSQLQLRQKELINQKHNIGQLSVLAETILGTHTIETYKTLKKQSYILLLLKWGDLIEGSNSQIAQVWNFLKEESQKLEKEIQ